MTPRHSAARDDKTPRRRGPERHAVSDFDPAVAIHLAGGSAGPETAGRAGDAPAAARQARHDRGPVHVQMGDRCAGRAGRCAGSRRVDWLVWVLAAPVAMTVAYGGTRILMAALTQLRDGLFAKVAMHAVRRLAHHVRAHAPAVAALSSRAQDRRADPRARARAKRHRDDRAHGDAAARAHHHRARPDRRPCCCTSSTGATWR